MSMNLVPKNKSAREFDATIDQWDYVADILDLAGVDYADMRFTNDGMSISSRNAKSWANAIRAYIREDAELLSKDPDKNRYITRPIGAKRNQYNKFKQEVFSVKSAGLSSDLGLLSGSPSDFFSSKTSEGQFYHGGEVVKLEDRRKKWLLRFSRWLDRSGGFSQW